MTTTQSHRHPDYSVSDLSRITLLLIVLLGLTHAALAEQYYIFTSFRGNGEDGLHLALSTDGYHWQALNGDKSLLKPEIGGYKLMRDPCVAQGPDGLFHMVWTSGWTTDKGQVIGYAESKDLIHWSPQRAIQLMPDEPKVRNLWAPEVFYDRHAGHWLVFWSSTIPGRFPQTDETGDSGYNHRIYALTTPDFQTFSKARLFFDPGFNVIDATMLQAGGKFYLFFKDERKNPVKKNLRYAVADKPDGPFGPPSQPFTGDWVEGPSAIKINGWYIVYYDHYASPHYYGAVRSRDLKHWQDCSKEMTFPRGQRHGTVIHVSPDVAKALLALK